MVGHSERSCKEQRVTEARLSENQYGPWMRAGSIRSPSKDKPLKAELNKDRRYWKFQDGELVERERSRSQTGVRILEFLENAEKENRAKQPLDKEGEVKRLGVTNSSTPRNFDVSTEVRGLVVGNRKGALGNRGPAGRGGRGGGGREGGGGGEGGGGRGGGGAAGLNQAVRRRDNCVGGQNSQEDPFFGG